MALFISRPCAMPKSSATGKPEEVEVVNEGPLLVEVVPPEPFDPVLNPDGKLPAGMVKKADNLTLSPQTTEADDMVTAGQRRINLIWENTQSRIALLVVIVGVILNSAVVVMIVFYNREVTVTQLALISICLQFINLTVGIVIGFYFSRTNHQATGGVGYKPESPYVGR